MGHYRLGSGTKLADRDQWCLQHIVPSALSTRSRKIFEASFRVVLMLQVVALHKFLSYRQTLTEVQTVMVDTI
jgi:hypothetical protein